MEHVTRHHYLVVANRMILALVFLLLLRMPQEVRAGQYLDFKYSDDGTNVTLTGYTGLGGSVVIPDSIAGMPVISIGNQTFDGISSLTNVTIPNSVTFIGKSAFANCINLNDVMIPNGVTSIGDFAFNHCVGLTNVVIGSSATNIGSSAFYNCIDLTNIIIPNSVVTIQSEAFGNCSNLINITIPNSVIHIKSFGFARCTSLKNVTIPNSVTNIGSYMFQYCPSLAEINVDPLNPNYSSVDGVLFDKKQTSLIHFPGGKSGDYIVPDSVTTVGYNESAFESCLNLTRVVIPSSVTNISRFSDCPRLTEITVDPINQVYSSMDGVLFNKDQTILAKCPGGKTGAYRIPSSVVSIGYEAFAGCVGLTGITIPISVTNIDIYGFSNCSSLTDITVEPLNMSFSSVDGILFNKNQKTLLQYPGGRPGSYLLPGSVTAIGTNSFSNCPNLTSVMIPDSVTLIGGWAFQNCTSLTNITIPNSNIKIGYFAFAGCTSLASIAVPDKVNYLGMAMLDYCIGLNSVSIGKGINRIESVDLHYCPNLTNISVDSLNRVCSSLDGVLFNKDKTALVRYPGGKTGHYLIPNSVTGIDSYAFLYCPNLTSVTIPNSVTNIGERTFQRCTNLTSVYFEGNAPTTGATIFSGSDNVTVYYKPNTTGWGSIFANRPTALWIEQPSYSEWADTTGLTSLFPNACGETDDADGDGANNLDEMRAGTDPTDPGSSLKFEAVPRPHDLSDTDKMPIESPKFALYFQSVPGRTYTLQGIDTIDGQWQTDVVVTATTTQQRVVLDRPPIQRFYRVTAQP